MKTVLSTDRKPIYSPEEQEALEALLELGWKEIERHSLNQMRKNRRIKSPALSNYHFKLI